MELKHVRQWIYFVMLVRSGRSFTCTREQLAHAQH